jgi:hypothetical protein
MAHYDAGRWGHPRHQQSLPEYIEVSAAFFTKGTLVCRVHVIWRAYSDLGQNIRMIINDRSDHHML